MNININKFCLQSPVDCLLDAGHSLGGSVSQVQTIRFFDYKKGVSLAPTKCFEPFGTRSEVDPSIAVKIDDYYFTTTLDIWASFKNWSNVLSGGYFFEDWKSLEVELIENYQKNSSMIYSNVKIFARQGDVIAELSAQVGSVVPLATNVTNNYYDYIPKQTSGLVAIPQTLLEPLTRLNVHSSSWYRYNNYSADGTLIPTGDNQANVTILKAKGSSEDIAKFKQVFKGGI